MPLQASRERGGEKALQNLGIVFALQGEVEEVVLRHELIERIGGQNQRGWHGDANAGKPARDAVLA